MSTSLTALIRRRDTAELTINGETLHVEYDPSAYTTELEDAFLSAIDAGRIGAAALTVLTGFSESDEEGVTRVVPGIMLGWDVVSDGEPLPATRDVLKSLDTNLLIELMNGLRDHLRPLAKSGATSNGTLTRKAR